MARIRGFRGKDTNYSFPVLRQEIFTPQINDEIAKDSGMDMLYRGDNGEYLSMVSRNYKLVKHEEVHNFMSDLLSNKMNLAPDFKKVVVGCGGARYMEWVELPQLSFDINHEDDSNDGGSIDKYIPSFIIHNSYNGSSPLKIQLANVRMICSNGLISLKDYHTITIKHVYEVNYERLTEQINLALETYVEDFRLTVKRLSMTPAFEMIKNVFEANYNRKFYKQLADNSKGRIEIKFDTDTLAINDLKVNDRSMSSMALLNMISEIARDSTNMNAQVEMLAETSRVFAL